MSVYQQYRHSLGKTKCRILDDEEIGLELPFGWAVEQTGMWYVGFLGEAEHTDPSTSLLAIVQDIWWRYNRTGSPLKGRPPRRQARTETVDQSTMQLSFLLEFEKGPDGR